MEKSVVKIAIPEVNKIIGKTEINHKIRKLLEISNDEYCVLDLIEKCGIKKLIFSYEEAYKRLGMIKSEIDPLIRELGTKKLIYFFNNSFKVTEKWINQFEVSKEEFEKFWEPVNLQGRVIKWTGSKTDAMNKYKLARKQYEGTYLYKQKSDYFKFLFENPDRMIMMASVFLNLQTKRFEEDFASQLKRSVNVVSTKNTVNREDLMND